MTHLDMTGYTLAPRQFVTADEVRDQARRVVALRGRYVAPKRLPPINNVIDWPAISDALPSWDYSIRLAGFSKYEEDQSPIFDPPLIAHIQKAMCGAAGISMTDIRSARKLDYLVVPRQLAMALARRLTDQGYPEIGRRFGGRDHTTALHAVQKMAPVIAELDLIAETTPLDQLSKMALKAWERLRPTSPQMRGKNARTA